VDDTLSSLGDVKSKLRLTPKEIEAIKSVALKVFGKDSQVWIFGSRVDKSLKGGDIDIYIEVSNMENLIEKKINYLVKLKDIIGEQKIDLIVKPKGCVEFICKEAKDKGVKL